MDSAAPTKATLYILAGMPFAGKTTLLKKLEERTDILPISFDKFWMDLESQMSEEEKKTLTLDYVTEKTKSEISRLLKEGKSVAYDTLNDTVELRDKLRELAASSGADAMIIYLKTPLEVINQRRKEYEKANVHNSMKEKFFHDSIIKFQSPLEHEAAIAFNHDADFEQWLEQNLGAHKK